MSALPKNQAVKTDFNGGNVAAVQDDNAMRLTECVSGDDKKHSLSLEKQDSQSDNNAMRLTQSVANWKIGNCEHCQSEYQKRVTWQKFCTDDCRIANWELTHGKTFKKGKAKTK